MSIQRGPFKKNCLIFWNLSLPILCSTLDKKNQYGNGMQASVRSKMAFSLRSPNKYTILELSNETLYEPIPEEAQEVQEVKVELNQINYFN